MSSPSAQGPTSTRVPGDCRAVVLAVRPEIDGGRWPIKRVVGERLAVEADIVADGHDVVRAVLRFRRESEKTFAETELVRGVDDTWRASFAPGELGIYRYTVMAWVDAWSTWREGFERKVHAAQDVSVELLEGAALVASAAERADKAEADSLRAAARALGPGEGLERRIGVALDAGLSQRMERHPDRSRAVVYPRELAVVVDRPLARFGAWYELFPRSTGQGGAHGTFRDAERYLPYVAEMGFDIVYLPPIHPIGRTHRKGRNNTLEAAESDPGSPWAVGAAEGGHDAVHPALGTLVDFEHFVASARALGLDVALDMAFQASPDHPWVRQHPEWFKRRPDGSIQFAENPPKKYQDIYPFDFEGPAWEELWNALRDVLLFWVSKGVRVFRVDNPHTKPIPFWEWCIASVKAKHPEVVFLAEAFTRPKLTYALAKAGFTQSYTYFTWRTTKHQLTEYLEELTRPPLVDVFRPNFWPTTPDIFPEHLQHAGRGTFLCRLVLAATLSPSYGIFGPSFELMENLPRPGSEELLDNEKYQLREWNIDAPHSLRHVVARLNRIRRMNPALQESRTLTFHPTTNDVVICFSKRTADGSNAVLVFVSLDPQHLHSAWVDLDLAALGLVPDAAFQAHDQLSDARWSWSGSRNYVELSPTTVPAHVMVVRKLERTENDFEYFL